MTGPERRHLKVFVSYGHNDAKWLDGKSPQYDLVPSLKRWLAVHDVTVEWDQEFRKSPDQRWRDEIRRMIEEADIALLLLSTDFANSEVVQEFELPMIQDRVTRGLMRFVTVLVDYIDDQARRKLHYIFERQILPDDTRPLLEYAERPVEFSRVKTEILSSLQNVVAAIREPRQPLRPHSISPAVSQPQSVFVESGLTIPPRPFPARPGPARSCWLRWSSPCWRAV